MPFECISPDVEEIPQSGENPDAYTIRNALSKAAAAMTAAGPSEKPLLVIACDTIVVLNSEILEKPRDPAHAETMLNKLSDQTHTVISGVCVKKTAASPDDATHTKTFTVETQVKIKKLTGGEIKAYVATGEPMDKAGGYAAQGIGSYMIERIDGSYSNVVGLPMCELIECLSKDFGVPLW